VAYLKLKGISKGFSRSNGVGRSATGAYSAVLRDINLAVDEGEFVCVVGRSGCGKTTLISLIAGLLKPDEGDILLEGSPIPGPGPDRGVVFQGYSLLPWMTVFENVYLGVEAAAAHLSLAEKRDRTEHFLRLVNLATAMKKRPKELSGGMRQRVAVARGLAMNPKILLLDEPFSALDALTRASLQQELARIWLETRKTVIMITNDIEEALLLADRIYPLTSGPGATLGSAIPVFAPRPRSHRQSSSADEYRRIRQEVFAFLIGQKDGHKTPLGPMGSAPEKESWA
jgi:nitrate/nitrite transport system ATP-binding protein